MGLGGGGGMACSGDFISEWAKSDQRLWQRSVIDRCTVIDICVSTSMVSLDER